MNTANKYDERLPRLTALAGRIADELDRIADAPADKLRDVQPTHIDHLEYTDQRHIVSWRESEVDLDPDAQNQMRFTANWLRHELPELAASIAGTDGVDITGDEEDRYGEFLPVAVRCALGRSLMCNLDQSTFWHPDDLLAATYGNSLYADTAAETFRLAWVGFVERDWMSLGHLDADLNLTELRLGRRA